MQPNEPEDEAFRQVHSFLGEAADVELIERRAVRPPDYAVHGSRASQRVVSDEVIE